MLRYIHHPFKNIRNFSSVSSSNSSILYEKNKSMIYYNPLNECESGHRNTNSNMVCREQDMEDMCKIKLQLEKIIKHNQIIIQKLRELNKKE
jgi:hypothetical protein